MNEEDLVYPNNLNFDLDFDFNEKYKELFGCDYVPNKSNEEKEEKHEENDSKRN